MLASPSALETWRRTFSGRRFLIQSLSGSINLMFNVSEFSKEKRSLSSFIVSKRLGLFKLGCQGALNLHQHVQVVVNISGSSQEIRVFSSNLPLAGLKVSKLKIGFSNLLVDISKIGHQILV